MAHIGRSGRHLAARNHLLKIAAAHEVARQSSDAARASPAQAPVRALSNERADPLCRRSAAARRWLSTSSAVSLRSSQYTTDPPTNGSRAMRRFDRRSKGAGRRRPR